MGPGTEHPTNLFSVTPAKNEGEKAHCQLYDHYQKTLLAVSDWKERKFTSSKAKSPPLQRGNAMRWKVGYGNQSPIELPLYVPKNIFSYLERPTSVITSSSLLENTHRSWPRSPPYRKIKDILSKNFGTAQLLFAQHGILIIQSNIFLAS
jgi:hypothetical protein